MVAYESAVFLGKMSCCAGLLAVAVVAARPHGSPAAVKVSRPVCCMAMVGVSHDTITMAQICTDYRVRPDTNRSPVGE